jgi:hypothetical protein
MCQDKDGFMWFATENGLSRFDGTHFKNFTVKDGLPDNEVLQVFADSKNRVWIGTFSNQVCFYYEGIVYNEKNCDLIKKIGLPKGNLEAVVEDKHGYIGLGFRTTVVIVTPSDSVLKYSVNAITENRSPDGTVFFFNGAIAILANPPNYSGLKYEFDHTSQQWVKKDEYGQLIPGVDSMMMIVKYDTVGKNHLRLMVPGQIFSIVLKNNFVEFVNTINGAWSIDTASLRLDRHFLPGKKISRTIKDTEKNIWFASMGEGVFKLPSQSIQTISGPANARGKEIFSITKYQNTILAGSEYSRAVLVDGGLNHKILNLANNLLFASPYLASTNRLYASACVSDSTVVLGYDGFLVKLEKGKPLFKYLSPIKSVGTINKEYIIVGTNFFGLKLRLSDLQITDTIWRERCTKVFYKDNCYYIGTLKGLYEVKEDRSYTYFGDLHMALTRRITDITSDPSGLLWVATSDDGVLALKNGKVVYHINDDNGLSSNICKTIFIDGLSAWVGTNKGINKISFHDGRYSITNYSTSDGLPSDVINALYVKDGRLWIGSPAGLSFFNESDIASSSICNLKILSVSVSGKSTRPDSTQHFSYRDNNFRFEYAGISFRSGNEIIYWYKLNGLDKVWKQTQANSIDFEALPSGNYKLELYAVNKYGVRSKSFVYSFVLTTPFWKTTWFYLLVFTLVFSLVLFFITRRNKRMRTKLEQANRFQKQLAELEQLALQSQMNPHFIFNCLNSIQQYILTNEKEKANLYLSKFSSLIRQTLDISAQKTITVAEEISYLRKYLDMELMRFGNNFE